MSKIMAIVCGLFLFSTAASAQRFNAFVGYSHIGFGPYSVQLDPLSPPLRRSKNGWNASLEAKVLPVLGIVADFSGYYGNSTAILSCSQYVAFCTAGNENFSLYSFTFGPQSPFHSAGLSPMPMRFSVSLFPAHRSLLTTHLLICSEAE